MKNISEKLMDINLKPVSVVNRRMAAKSFFYFFEKMKLCLANVIVNDGQKMNFYLYERYNLVHK